jgi:hypothetical protein
MQAEKMAPSSEENEALADKIGHCIRLKIYRLDAHDPVAKGMIAFPDIVTSLSKLRGPIQIGRDSHAEVRLVTPVF